MAVFECALFSQQLGSWRRVVVDRRIGVIFPLAHAKARMVGIIGFWTRQARHVADAVVPSVLYADGPPMLVFRNPVPERRLSGCAAKAAGLLQKHNLVAEPAAEQGRG